MIGQAITRRCAVGLPGAGAGAVPASPPSLSIAMGAGPCSSAASQQPLARAPPALLVRCSPECLALGTQGCQLSIHLSWERWPVAGVAVGWEEGGCVDERLDSSRHAGGSSGTSSSAASSPRLQAAWWLPRPHGSHPCVQVQVQVHSARSSSLLESRQLLARATQRWGRL